MKFSDWLEENWEEDNMCPPPIGTQEALDFLTDYFLGEDFYVVLSMPQKQVNTIIVAKILEGYSKKYRKELKERRKKSRVSL